MSAVLVATGLVLVAAAVIDLSWTTVAAGSGAGPITGRLAGGLWTVALALHRRRPSHALLSLAGVAILFAVLAAWLALMLTGWVLVFSAADAAVLSSSTREPADLVSRMYFTGYTVFTLGNGDFVPGDGLWQLATVASVGSGLVLITLSITYLVPVASAVAQRRQLASYISSLGATPHQILTTAWDGTSFTALSEHLLTLASLVQTSEQQHLAYPVLHYFHSGDRASAAAPSLVNLTQAVDLLAHGVAVDVRPGPGVLQPMQRTIDSFLSTLEGAHFTPAAPLAAPSLVPLRQQGIPTLSDSEYTTSEPLTRERRALLAGLLTDDGWPRDVTVPPTPQSGSDASSATTWPN